MFTLVVMPAVGVAALGDRLNGQGEQQGKTDAESQQQRPPFLFRSDLPKPTPMQR